MIFMLVYMFGIVSVKSLDSVLKVVCLDYQFFLNGYVEELVFLDVGYIFIFVYIFFQI